MDLETSKFHKAVIIAFLDGQSIQKLINNTWVDCKNPTFNEGEAYRVKPLIKYVPYTYKTFPNYFLNPTYIIDGTVGGKYRVVGIHLHGITVMQTLPSRGNSFFQTWDEIAHWKYNGEYLAVKVEQDASA